MSVKPPVPYPAAYVPSSLNLAVNEYGFDLDQQSDGKVVLCGTSGQFGFGAARDFLMARFNTDGSPDAEFGNNGVVITSIQPDFDDANGCAIKPDGKIVSAGFTSGFNTGGDNDLALVRYESGSPLAIEDNTMSADMYAWPNPTSGPVRLSGLNSGATSVRVFDAHGSMVMGQVLRNGSVDLGPLEPGTYFLHSGAGNRAIATVVKW